MKDNILDWLSKTGYPLELRTQKIMQECGYDTFQGFHYRDPEIDTLREIDVFAVRSIRNEELCMNYNLIMECKNSTKPFVMIRKQIEPDHGNDLAFIPSNNYYTSDYNILSFLLNFDNLVKLPQPAANGTKLIQAFTNSDETIHKAAFSLKKAFSRLKEFDNSNVLDYASDNFHSYHVPVLVVGSTLFESYLTREGETDIREVQSAVWDVAIDEFEDTLSIVVVQFSALRELALNLSVYAEGHFEMLQNAPQCQIKQQTDTTS